MSRAMIVSAVAMSLFAIHCAASEEGTAGEASASALSSAISSRYGITVFGGPGDYQKLACGGHSRDYQTSKPYYAASSQRYGCHVKLKLTATNGKCVVVSTEDAGPASRVETRAESPILDVSPAAAKQLFGTTSIGWRDVKNGGDKYKVTAERTTLPMGPCDADKTSTTPNDGDGELGANDPAPPNDDGDGPRASSCSTDGQCNPGHNGSGKICQGGQCVPGCRTDAQCPGNESCQGGLCQ